MQIYVLCVLYNRKISSVRSLRQILDLQGKYQLQIYIEDNSSESFCAVNQQEYEELYKDKIIYECNHANLGLSKAYNKAISKMEDDSWVMLIDDDTYFSEEYLTNAFDAALNEKAAVVSGIIYNQRGYMSPLKKLMLKNNKSNFITKPGLYDNIYCINSGLLYKVSLIREIGGYDENLFLDMVDYWFMEKLKSLDKNRNLIVQGEITQNFSGAQANGLKADLRRYEIFRKDFSTFCKATGKSNMYMCFMLTKRRINIFFSNIVYSLRSFTNVF